MNADEFRRIALSMPEAFESAHMGHADFRVAGKIYATLGYPDEHFGVLVLAPEEQLALLHAYPKAFAPAKGAWGRRGSTNVRLDAVSGSELREAMWAAWLRRAPKRLVAQHQVSLRNI